MNFNFKQALERENYCSPIENKAEDLLILVSKELREKNLTYADISAIFFDVFGRSKCIIKIGLTLKKSDEFIYIYTTESTYNKEESVAIVEVIEDELKNEGFNCIDNTEGQIEVLKKEIIVKF